MSDSPRDDDGVAMDLLERLDSLPLVSGVVAGAASFVVGYVLFFALVLATGNVRFSSGLWPILRAFSYLYYNAFNVPTYENIVVGGNASGGALNGTAVATGIERWSNQITGWRRIVREGTEQVGTVQPDLPVPALVYLAVPVVALLAAGFFYAWATLPPTDDLRTLIGRSLPTAFAVAVGFVLMAALGTFLFVGTNDPAGPAKLVRHAARQETILYGTVYALLAGGVGVVLGQVVPALQRSTEGAD